MIHSEALGVFPLFLFRLWRLAARRCGGQYMLVHCYVVGDDSGSNHALDLSRVCLAPLLSHLVRRVLASSSVIQSSLPKTPDRGSQKARGWRVTLSTSVSCERKVRGWIVEVAVGGRSGIPKQVPPGCRGRAGTTRSFHLVPPRIPTHFKPPNASLSSLFFPLPLPLPDSDS